jgi:DNA-binding GntR family transcriptional regulator
MLKKMEESVARRDKDAFARADIESHTLVWEQADNLHLKKVLHSMIGPIFMFMANSAEHYDWHETLELHREMVTHINNGNREAAQDSIKRHMENSCERSVGVLRARTNKGTDD